MNETGLFRIWVFLAGTPLLWLTITVLAYVGSLWVRRLAAGHALANPVLMSVAERLALVQDGAPAQPRLESFQHEHLPQHS